MTPRLPTRRGDWRLLGRTLRLVLGIPGYAVFALVTAVAALSVFVFSQNVSFVSFVVTAPYAVGTRVSILLELYPFVGTSYGPVTGLTLVAVSALTGVNISFVTYHLREHGLAVEQSGGSAVGVVLGLFGAGCAACGSAILAGLFSLVGAAGLLTVLPLEGLEFSLLAVVVLVLSMYWLADGMRGGEIRGCPVESGR
jgi:hypothetical protein